MRTIDPAAELGARIGSLDGLSYTFFIALTAERDAILDHGVVAHTLHRLDVPIYHRVRLTFMASWIHSYLPITSAIRVRVHGDGGPGSVLVGARGGLAFGNDDEDVAAGWILTGMAEWRLGVGGARSRR